MNNQRLIELLRQMLKNSKKSDREIAKGLEVSQATVSRLRTRLEKEGYIKTYTVIPDFVKLGYQILAFTFTRMKSYPTPEEAKETVQRAAKWASKHPNVIFSSDGEGLGGKDVIMISFHKSYSRYADFMRGYAMDWGYMIAEFESFIVSLGSGFKIKPLNLKYLADDE